MEVNLVNATIYSYLQLFINIIHFLVPLPSLHYFSPIHSFLPYLLNIYSYYHHPTGTNVESDKKAIAKGMDIVVASPGRLLQHLKDTPGFANRLARTSVLVLDEADRLLDMGFQRDIAKILGFLKPSADTRQTLLFSATFSDEVKTIAGETLKKGYQVIDTVGEEDGEQTHAHVPQRVMIAPQGQQIRALTHILHEESKKSNDKFKVICFFATARQAAYYSGLFNKAGVSVLEMHSRKTQVCSML